MANTKSILDALLDGMDEIQEAAQPPDSIDEVLNEPGRVSHVKSIRDDPIVAEFRRELAAGKIRANTANRLLELVGRALDLL